MFIPSASSQNPPAPPQESPVVEIVDSCNRSLGALPLDEARRQKLFCRMILVLLYNQQGKLSLVKFPERKDGGALAPYRWDIGLVTYGRPGESTKDGALRSMRDNLGRKSGRLTFIRTWLTAWDEEQVFVSLYKLHTQGNSLHSLHTKNSILAVDQEELSGLATHCPELLTSRVLSFYRQEQLFAVL